MAKGQRQAENIAHIGGRAYLKEMGDILLHLHLQKLPQFCFLCISCYSEKKLF